MVTSRALEALAGGHLRHIHGVVVDGNEPVHSFLAELQEPDLSEFYAEFAKLEDSGALLLPKWQRMGNWFKPLKHVSNIWQLSSTTHRILGFRHGQVLVLTNGFYKAGGKTPNAEVELAAKLQAKFKASL